MSQNVLKVNTEKQNTNAKNIADLVDDISDAYNVINEVSKLKTNWDTGASKVFLERCTEVKKQCVQVETNLKNRTDELKKAGLIYEEAEKESEKEVQKLSEKGVFC